MKIEITATKKDNLKRLDLILARHISEISRERIKSIIKENGAILLNSKTIKNPAYKVKEGDVYSITIPPNKPLEIVAEDIPLDIIYEDDSLIVINKPAGISVHPSGNIVSGTLVNALLHHCKESLSGIGGVERPGIVHRLDKGTSGVMVVAKSDKAHISLSEQFSKRTMERSYLALCYGTMLSKKGEIRTQIARHCVNRKKMAVVENGGKMAHSTFIVEEKFKNENISLLRFKLHTGRTHQIRVHATHLGFPLLCDPLYGRAKKINNEKLKEKIKSINHQLLHAQSLGFTHPKTGEFLTFESKLPDDMHEILKILKSS